MRSSVLLIYTGGTIGMKTDPKSGTLMPFDFNGIYSEFPALRNIDADIEIMPFDPIDSSNVSPELWIRLAEIIRDNYERFDGFVILHGTDTMSYTSSALSFMLEGLSKPIVFTGSQIPIGVLRTDGRENLITAVEIAAAKDAQGRAMVPEVSLYFQNKLFRANRTTKISAEDLSAFASYNYPPLAEVGVNIHYNIPYIYRPLTHMPFAINTRLGCDVSIVRLFPGITERIFTSMLSAEGVKAIILQTYGSGNAPTYNWFIDALRRTIAGGVDVLNVTQCLNGAVDMDIYETGMQLQRAGVISGKGITTEAAVTKIMCLLGQNYTRTEFSEKLKKSMRGEIN